MTKPTKWVCAQHRLRLAWASAQSDQSLRCPHEESLGPTQWTHSEDSDQTGRMPRLIWVFAGRTLILFVFVMSWLISSTILFYSYFLTFLIFGHDRRIYPARDLSIDESNLLKFAKTFQYRPIVSTNRQVLQAVCINHRPLSCQLLLTHKKFVFLQNGTRYTCIHSRQFPCCIVCCKNFPWSFYVVIIVL